MKTKGKEVNEIKEVKDFKEFKEGIFKMGRCDVIVTIDNGLWHLSISCRKNQPSYKENKEARYRYVPDDVIMAQIFPPKSEFVNVHPFCHHLWEIGVGKGKEMKPAAPAILSKMRKQYYFVDESFAEFDDEHCYSKDLIIEAMKERGIKELKVFIAKKQDMPDYFYCLAVQDISEKGECGKQCCDYLPRNGKSGICKYYGFFHEPDKELTFKI